MTDRRPHPVATLILAAALALSAGLASAQTGGGKPLKGPTLSAMDSNGDGKVTVTEAEAFFARGPGGGGSPKGGKSGSAQSGSGQEPPPPPPGSASGKKGPGGKPPEGGHGPKASDMDTNGDGVISQAEFDAALTKRPARRGN